MLYKSHINLANPFVAIDISNVWVAGAFVKPDNSFVKGDNPFVRVAISNVLLDEPFV